MSCASISLQDVRFSAGPTSFHFDTHIEPGEIVAVMGPSGAGKTTFLNLIAGFEYPRSGNVLIDNIDVSATEPGKRPVTMVFQENNLFGHLDVGTNVGLGRSPSLRLTELDRKQIADALKQTGLEGKTDRMPSELSGGERQRVAIARALVRDRPVLLLDEPFASLGPALRSEMLDLVRSLQMTTGMTVVMVSHHPDDARAIAQRLLFVDDGKIVADGIAAELLGKSPPPAIAEYLGKK